MCVYFKGVQLQTPCCNRYEIDQEEKEGRERERERERKQK